MKITMVTFGSTGDVHPYIILGRELKKRGHDIAICAFPQFESRILSEGFRFYPIRGDLRDFMAQCMSHNDGVMYLKHVIDTVKPNIFDMLGSIEEACDGAEAIVAGFFGEVFKSIAQVRHVPFIQTQFFMMDPNSDSPVTCAPGQNVGPVWNKLTYPIAYLLISMVEKIFLSEWRSKRGMEPRKITTGPIYEMNGHPVPVVYLMSPLIVPRPRNWGENIHMTGYLLERNQSDFTPSPQLDAFLNANSEQPVYIGFGSMTSNDVGKTLRIVLEAVKKAGVRAVLSRGWGDTDIQNDNNIFMVDYVPHDWLFRHVSAVVHHGGAGTTAAGIIAGKPTLIVPFGGDQPFWAERVHELGVGPRGIPRELLTVDKLSKALYDLVSNKRYPVAARELGQRLSLEQGDVAAADVIENEIRKWLQQEELNVALVPGHD